MAILHRVQDPQRDLGIVLEVGHEPMHLWAGAPSWMNHTRRMAPLRHVALLTKYAPEFWYHSLVDALVNEDWTNEAVVTCYSGKYVHLTVIICNVVVKSDRRVASWCIFPHVTCGYGSIHNELGFINDDDLS